MFGKLEWLIVGSDKKNKEANYGYIEPAQLLLVVTNAPDIASNYPLVD
jgi:hypothetical protein